jgi:hypothetical protein
MLKLGGGGSRQSIFDQEKIYFHVRTIKKKKWQVKEALALNCRRLIWIIIIIIINVQQYRWRCTSPWRWLEGIKHCTLARQNPLLSPSDLLIASKHPINSVSSRTCSLLARIDVLGYLHASSNESKPLLQLRNRRSPLLRLRFLGFFRGALLPSLNNIVESDLLIMGVSNTKTYAFSIVRRNLRVWLIALRLRANDVSAERRRRND